jgi:addiction module HigA family antidote
MLLPENRIPTYPGGVLLEEFLIPMGISQAALAKHPGVPVRRVHEIARGKRGVPPDMAGLLAQAFVTPPEFWMDLKVSYDLARK